MVRIGRLIDFDVGMMLLTKVAGMPHEEAQRWFDGVIDEVKSGKIHAYSWQ